MDKADPSDYCGEDVVIFTESRLNFIGKLASFDDKFFKLQDLAIYDEKIIRVSLEEYIMEMQKDGVRAGAKEMVIRADKVISIAKLSDMIY